MFILTGVTLCRGTYSETIRRLLARCSLTHPPRFSISPLNSLFAMGKLPCIHVSYGNCRTLTGVIPGESYLMLAP